MILRQCLPVMPVSLLFGRILISFDRHDGSSRSQGSLGDQILLAPNLPGFFQFNCCFSSTFNLQYL